MSGTERMTDRASRVMLLAEQEARRRGSPAVEPEHVLLGLTMERQGIAFHVLREAGVTAERLVADLPAGPALAADGPGPPPWSHATAGVVSRAHAERVTLGHNYVGTEHLVIGLALSGDGTVPDLLSRFGATTESVRRSVYEILGHEFQPARWSRKAVLCPGGPAK